MMDLDYQIKCDMQMTTNDLPTEETHFEYMMLVHY